MALNAWDEDKGTLKHWVHKDKLKQRVLLKASGVFKRYGGTSVPTVFWVDRNGIIVDAVDSLLGKADLEKRTKKLLAAQ